MSFQVLIHKYYETIKLVLLIVIAGTAFFILYNQNQTANRMVEDAATEAIAREKDVAKLLEADQENIRDILDNQERQTRIMCILFRTSNGGELTPEERRVIEDECEQAIRSFDNSDSNGSFSPSAQGSSQPSQSHSQPSQQNQKPNDTPGSGEAREEPAPRPREPVGTPPPPSADSPPPPPLIVIPLFDEPILPCFLGVCLL